MFGGAARGELCRLVAERFYKAVYTLREALQLVAPGSAASLERESDKRPATGYLELNDRCMLATTCDPPPFRTPAKPRRLSLSQVLSLAAPNTISALKTSQMCAFLCECGFEELNSRIGSDVLIFLLKSFSIFVPLQNRNYLQITGPAIYNLMASPSLPLIASDKPRSPWQSSFQRREMLYPPRMKEAYPVKFVLRDTPSTSAKVRELVLRVSHGEPLKTTKRLRLSQRQQQLVPLFQQLLHKFEKCQFRCLLEHYCPMPAIDRHGNAGESLEESKTRCAKLVASHCSYKQVFTFLSAVLRHIIPPQLWGSKHNRLLFLTQLQRFISLRRWESMTVQQMVGRMKLSHCQWACLPPKAPDYSPRPPDPLLFARLMFWIVNDVVIPTIKAFFYVTDHSEGGNRLFYFRKGVWSAVKKLGMIGKKGSIFNEMTEDNVHQLLRQQTTLGVSSVRLLPKMRGVRPIINLGSRLRLFPGQPLQSVNYQLETAFLILKYELARQPDRLTGCCLGFKDIHQRLSTFIMHHRERPGSENSTPLFVNVDIRQCYDSILPCQLLRIFNSGFFSESSYLLRRYASVGVSNGRVRRTFYKEAMPRNNYLPFCKFVQTLKSQYDCIFTDQVTYPVIYASNVVALLKKHLFRNIIRIGGKFLCQIQGIAQGSKISSLLCGLYYSEMEKLHLSFIDPASSLLVRFVDDFLLITYDDSVAVKFLSVMTTGIPSFNCFINTSKTNTNFNPLPSGEIQRKPDGGVVRWCGLLINTDKLHVQWDYHKLHRRNIKDSTTLVLFPKPLFRLKAFTKRAVTWKCLAVLFDCKMLQPKEVVMNVYQCFLFAALKFLSFLHGLWASDVSCAPRKLFRILVAVFAHFHSLASRRCSRAGNGSFFDVSLPAVSWLGGRAFCAVIRRHERKRLKLLCTILESYYTTVSFSVGFSELKHCLRAASNCKIHARALFTMRC